MPDKHVLPVIIRTGLMILVFASAITAARAMTVIQQESGPAADGILGVWLVPEQDTRIEIYLDEDSTYSGRIIWLLEEKDENGQVRKDVLNQNIEMARRPLMNIQVLSGFRYIEDAGKWAGGRVYNFRNGREYWGILRLQEDGSLQVKNYLKGLKFLGKNNIWERVNK